MSQQDTLANQGTGGGEPPDETAVRGPQDPQLTAEVTALLRETEAAWNSQDFLRWLALWDADDKWPYYLAGEEQDFFVRREQLEKYLDPHGAPVTQGIRVRFSNISARWLADDLAYAAYHMCSEMKLVFVDKPFISKLRATSVLRRKPEGWRYICYAEAFQSPTMYFQRLIQDAVPDDYAEFFSTVMRTKQPRK
jgi:hypothetical protein